MAGSSWRFQEYSKSRAVQGLPSDHFESLRMVNVHTEPSAFDATLLATYGTGSKLTVHFMSPAQSDGTPEQYRSLLKS